MTPHLDDTEARLRQYAYFVRSYDQGRETRNPYENRPDQLSIDLFVLLAERRQLTQSRAAKLLGER